MLSLVFVCVRVCVCVFLTSSLKMDELLLASILDDGQLLPRVCKRPDRILNYKIASSFFVRLLPSTARSQAFSPKLLITLLFRLSFVSVIVKLKYFL